MKRFVAFFILGFISFGVTAQAFPTKTIRLVSGVTPGSASDTMAPREQRTWICSSFVTSFAV